MEIKEKPKLVDTFMDLFFRNVIVATVAIKING